MATDFGTDLSALSPGLLSGRDNLIEALRRRMQTPKRSLFYDPEYGTYLYDWLGEGITDGGVGCAVTVETDLEEDPRVRSATATVAQVHPRGISLEVTVETSEGPFELVVEGMFAADARTPQVQVDARGLDN